MTQEEVDAFAIFSAMLEKELTHLRVVGYENNKRLIRAVNRLALATERLNQAPDAQKPTSEVGLGPKQA